MSRPQGHSAAGRIRSIEKSNELIGKRTRDLPACSRVPQPTTLPRAPLILENQENKLDTPRVNIRIENSNTGRRNESPGSNKLAAL
jgi:hypothetical protein